MRVPASAGYGSCRPVNRRPDIALHVQSEDPMVFCNDNHGILSSLSLSPSPLGFGIFGEGASGDCDVALNPLAGVAQTCAE